MGNKKPCTQEFFTQNMAFIPWLLSNTSQEMSHPESVILDLSKYRMTENLLQAEKPWRM